MKIKIISAWIWLVLFVITIVFLINRPTEIEKEQKLYQKINKEKIEKSEHNELLKQEIIKISEEIKINVEEIKKLEHEEDCIKKNIENVLEWQDKQPCEEITLKKKTIVLKK